MVVESELKALQFDFSDFHNGQEFSDPGYPYINDLDIFGPGSLFQSINRTTTAGGAKVLANWFMTPEKCYSEIVERQNFVNELSGMRSWRLDFLTEGNLLQVADNERSFLTDTNQSVWDTNQLRVFKNAVVLLPIFTVSSLLFFIITGLHLVFVTFLLINFCFGFYYRKEIERFYNIFGNKLNIVRKYNNIIQLTGIKLFTALVRSKRLMPLSAWQISGIIIQAMNFRLCKKALSFFRQKTWGIRSLLRKKELITTLNYHQYPK